jgi:P4 family phage/plasmid primase-like protien
MISTSTQDFKTQAEEWQRQSDQQSDENDEKWRQWLALYNAGINLVPSRMGLKHPTRLWKHLQDNRLSPDQFDDWREEYYHKYNTNMFVVTGNTPDCKLVVVDADDVDAIRCVDVSCPATPLTVQRCAEKKHYYYRHDGDEDVKTVARIVMDGERYNIDIRGDGGGVVAPYSTHPSGMIYLPSRPITRELLLSLPIYDKLWLAYESSNNGKSGGSDDHGIPESDWATMIQDPTLPALDVRLDQARTYLGGCKGCRQGDGNEKQCMLVCRRLTIGFALPERAAVDLLMECWAERPDQQYADGSHYPWPLKEIVHKVRDAIKTRDVHNHVRCGDMLDTKGDNPWFDDASIPYFEVPDEDEQHFDEKDARPDDVGDPFEIEPPPKPRTKKGSKEPRKDTAAIALAYLKACRPQLLFINKDPHYYAGTRYIVEDDLDSDIRKFLIKSGLPHNNLYVSNVHNDIKAMRRRRDTMPFWTDGTHHDEIIPFANGLLNLGKYLEDGSIDFLDHTPRYVSDFCLDYAFDPTATCPLWLKTLGEIFEDDADKIALLQEWFGYCLTDDQEHHKLLLKVGVTRSGKGTTDHVLEHLVGQEYCCGINIHHLVGTYGCANLVGKKVGLIGEVHLERDNNKYAIMELLKNITGLDLIDIERKYRDPISLRLPVKLSISANDMPRFFDASGALSSRLLILRYNRSFEAKPNKALRSKLTAELPGVALWALAGLRRLRQQGYFTEPAESIAVLTSVRREGSPCLAFVQDCCQVSRRIDPGNLAGVELTDRPCELPKQQCRDAVTIWGEDNNIQPNFDLMCKDLRSILPRVEETQIRRDHSRFRLFRGITLNTDMQSRVDDWAAKRRLLSN